MRSRHVPDAHRAADRRQRHDDDAALKGGSHAATAGRICGSLADLRRIDEPAAGMNPHETAELMDIIRFIRDEFDMTILLIEHDMKFVAGLCDELTVLNFGTVLAQGDTKTALNDPEVIKAYIGG